jgi:hypothetical protein
MYAAIELPVTIDRQPDYTTCGPTSLHAIHRYCGDPISLQAVIAETPKLPGGGTLVAPWLAMRGAPLPSEAAVSRLVELVPEAGLEPARPSRAQVFETCASADSATPAKVKLGFYSGNRLSTW